MAKHVMVIDDEAEFCGFIFKILSAAGYYVSAYLDAREALPVMEAIIPNLVITDMIMPGMEGVEVIRRIKKTNPDIKILALSGGGMLDADVHLEMASRTQADGALRKPFLKHELLNLVEELTSDIEENGKTHD